MRYKEPTAGYGDMGGYNIHINCEVLVAWWRDMGMLEAETGNYMRVCGKWVRAPGSRGSEMINSVVVWLNSALGDGRTCTRLQYVSSLRLLRWRERRAREEGMCGRVGDKLLNRALAV